METVEGISFEDGHGMPQGEEPVAHVEEIDGGKVPGWIPCHVGASRPCRPPREAE